MVIGDGGMHGGGRAADGRGGRGGVGEGRLDGGQEGKRSFAMDRRQRGVRMYSVLMS